MIPHYTPHHQECEYCGDTIYIGYECIKTKDGYFCDERCLANHLLEGEMRQDIFLVGNRKEWNL